MATVRRNDRQYAFLGALAGVGLAPVFFFAIILRGLEGTPWILAVFLLGQCVLWCLKRMEVKQPFARGAYTGSLLGLVALYVATRFFDVVLTPEAAGVVSVALVMPLVVGLVSAGLSGVPAVAEGASRPEAAKISVS